MGVVVPRPHRANFPVSANELRLTMRGQVEQQRVLAAVKLLGKCNQRLGSPGSAVSESHKC